MTLAQVLAFTGIILLSMVTWACMLPTIALLLPRQTIKAETTLENSPVASFFGGLGMAILLMIGLVLVNLHVPVLTLLGILISLALAGLMILGSAGMVRLISKRIGLMNGDKASFQTLMRGSIIFSVGLNVPVLGWFLFVPLTLLFTLGAGLAGLFPGQQAMDPVMTPPAGSDYDVMERQGVK